MTFPHSPSFGASLQMYALYEVLSSMGNEVYVINYINSYMRNKKHIYGDKTYNILRYAASKLVGYPSKIKFKKFEKKISMYPQKVTSDVKELNEISKNFQFVICGSDQIWNPDITGHDLSYFLNFCDDECTRVSFAPSFGVTNLEDKYSEAILKELMKFKNISLREQTGQAIVEGITGKKYPVVVDPTMLLDTDKWSTLCIDKRNLPKRYIADFTFNQNQEVIEFMTHISEVERIPIIQVGGNLVTKLSGKLTTGAIGPQEWLSVIKNADIVVTDSFHGAVFSILFEKKMFVSLASSTNTKLKMLLELFEMENRTIDSRQYEDYEDTDYNKVNEILVTERKRSIKFLLDSIGLEG